MKGLPEGFARFWTAWPNNERKQDKAKCLAHWRLHQLEGAAETITADVAVKRQTTKWKGGYVEAPLVYLRGRRWEDGVTPGADSMADWRESRSGIEGKARELGLEVWTEEGWVAGRFPEFTRWAKKVERAADLKGARP